MRRAEILHLDHCEKRLEHQVQDLLAGFLEQLPEALQGGRGQRRQDRRQQQVTLWT